MHTTVFLQAHLSGAIADGVLRDATRLEVVSVFSRSIYACDDNGNLVCFLKSGMEPGPLNILCFGWPEDGLHAVVSPGESISRITKDAWRSRNLDIAFASAVLWKPPFWPRADSGRIGKGLSALRTGLAKFAPQDSLASLFLCCPPYSLDITANPIANALFIEALPSIRHLDDWLRHSPRPFDFNILSLMGLGQGLTPSGDDLLGGALLALRAVGMTEERAILARHISTAAGRLTNSISAAHLSAAIQGLGAEVLHLFIIALMQGGEGLHSVAARLSLIGHTSGWDAAAGVVLVLGAYAGMELPPAINPRK